MTPTTPTSPSAPDSKPKKANPLTDLVDTEKVFVDQLTGIIRVCQFSILATNILIRTLPESSCCMVPVEFAPS
jgi:hypothetical protein